jgi:hypothetical protein
MAGSNGMAADNCDKLTAMLVFRLYCMCFGGGGVADAAFWCWILKYVIFVFNSYSALF